ncbi:MAG TPA: FAD-binding oxidoreductase [Pyrinomonadaceae bacterium]|nr:FAD-binding oxidoreductase [Pyrinomonadaceae bacterium]
MQVKTELDQLTNYLTDASNMPGGHAEKLFIPESTEEIAEILREANEAKILVTISGARTGTVGGAIPFGGYVVSLERLNKIANIDKERKTAVVGAGVILHDLQKAAEAENLFYPPDPTEWSCQVGGTVATNASGSRSFKYGATRDYVNALMVVLASGDVLNIRRGETIADENGVVELTTEQGNTITAKRPTYKRPHVRKNVSGYFNQKPLDAIDLFIGSEGTLGVITEIEFSLLAKAEGFFSGVVFFENESDLLAFVEEARDYSFASRKCGQAVRGPSIDASLLEYFDKNALEFIRERFPEVPENMQGAIFFEQETTDETEDALFEQWNELLEKYKADVDRSWFTTTDQDREKMREFRHSLPVAVNERIARYARKKVGTDMAVPDENFAGFLRFYKQTLDASGLDYVIFGHIGDCHLHANLLPKDETEAEKARHIYGRCVAQAIMLGGTVSAEHGIGKLKRKYLDAMMGERYLNEMAVLKQAFDPNGILGRGNMFDAKFLS